MFHSCPFVVPNHLCIPFAIIRVNPCPSVANEPRPSVAWNLFRNLHQQISGWKARATCIRVHSCPFVVQNPLHSCPFVVQNPLHSCSFVVPNHPFVVPPPFVVPTNQSNFPATHCHRIPTPPAATHTTTHRFLRITRPQRTGTAGFPNSRESAESAAVLPKMHNPATCTLIFRQLSAARRLAPACCNRDSRPA